MYRFLKETNEWVGDIELGLRAMLAAEYEEIFPFFAIQRRYSHGRYGI